MSEHIRPIIKLGSYLDRQASTGEILGRNSGGIHKTIFPLLAKVYPITLGDEQLSSVGWKDK
jgi:hypothetical protein